MPKETFMPMNLYFEKTYSEEFSLGNFVCYWKVLSPESFCGACPPPGKGDLSRCGREAVARRLNFNEKEADTQEGIILYENCKKKKIMFESLLR